MMLIRDYFLLTTFGCLFHVCEQQNAQDIFADFVIGAHRAFGYNIIRNPNASSTSIHQNHFVQVPPNRQQPSVKMTSNKPNIRTTSRPKYERCGKNKKYVPLIKYGERASKGDWPWVVAMYKKETLKVGHSQMEFKCGATLISSRVVLTAAHCVTRPNLLPLPVETVLLKLGAHNLNDETDDTVINRGVSTITVHEGHNEQSKNDIALLVMSQVVRFSFYIRPICLWTFSKNQNIIDGKSGMVVGWGKDETDSVTSEPKTVVVPIISVDKCRAAGAEYFPLTTKRTFCGGGRDGSGPCAGDSGAGLFILYNNTWYLRGIVSLSVSKTRSCDLNNYVIYTDVAMYEDWIQSNIN